jgi:hypothetical protein
LAFFLGGVYVCRMYAVSALIGTCWRWCNRSGAGAFSRVHGTLGLGSGNVSDLTGAFDVVALGIVVRIPAQADPPGGHPPKRGNGVPV